MYKSKTELLWTIPDKAYLEQIHNQKIKDYENVLGWSNEKEIVVIEPIPNAKAGIEPTFRMHRISKVISRTESIIEENLSNLAKGQKVRL